MAKNVKDAYSEILRLRNEFYQKWQEASQYDDNRGPYKAKYEAFDKALELLTPSIVDSQPEEPVNEELEDELDRYLPSVFSKDMDGDNPRFTTWFKALRKTALHFADWQMQQMMKDAVDAFIYKGGIRLKEWPLPEKCGEHLDSVKVIIIKED